MTTAFKQAASGAAAPGGAPPCPDGCAQVALPPALSRWPGEVDMAQFAARLIVSLAGTLHPLLVPGPPAGVP